MRVEPKKTTKNMGNQKFIVFLIVEFFILIISIIIPLLLVSSNQTGSCLHHFEESNGTFWIIGRALGFSALIWFIISSLYGVYTKKLARFFKSYKKARDLHCLNASISISIFLAHVISLLSSDPWGSLIFEGETNHIPESLFIAKLATGVIFGIIMFSVFFSAFFFRDMKRMKKLGFKNFIRVHYIMLWLSLLLAVHIFLINTEILVIIWG